MPTLDTSYPPAAPTVDGRNITVDTLLNNPLRLTKRIAAIANERMISDKIFSAGAPAVGGAIVFDRVLENDLYPDRDVQEIEPGSEFPLLTDSEASPEVRRAAKRGGADEVTYESIRRNNFDVVNRKIVRITNSIVRKCDRVSVSSLLADPNLKTVTATNWSDPSTRSSITDVHSAVAGIDALDLGYTADTVLLNPLEAAAMFADKEVRDMLPRENAAANPILSGRLGNLLGLYWMQSNAVPKGEAFVLAAKVVGSWHDEVPLYSRVTDEPRREVKLIQAARVGAPVITDPLAVVRLVGLS